MPHRNLRRYGLASIRVCVCAHHIHHGLVEHVLSDAVGRGRRTLVVADACDHGSGSAHALVVEVRHSEVGPLDELPAVVDDGHLRCDSASLPAIAISVEVHVAINQRRGHDLEGLGALALIVADALDGDARRPHVDVAHVGERVVGTIDQGVELLAVHLD